VDIVWWVLEGLFEGRDVVKEVVTSEVVYLVK
jgi:hypothetical protein